MYFVNVSILTTAVADFLTFAQEGGAPAGGAPGGGAAAPEVNPLVQMAPMLIMFVILFYFIVMRPQKREQQKRQDILGGLKKNDKVLTIGGIIGTIVDLSNDGARVTLRVDDGTHIKFTRSRTQGPYNEKPEADTTDKK